MLWGLLGVSLGQYTSALKVHDSYLESLVNTDLWIPPLGILISLKDSLGIGVFKTSLGNSNVWPRLKTSRPLISMSGEVN